MGVLLARAVVSEIEQRSLAAGGRMEPRPSTMWGLLLATLPLAIRGVDLTLYGGAFESSATIAYAEVCARYYSGWECRGCHIYKQEDPTVLNFPSGYSRSNTVVTGRGMFAHCDYCGVDLVLHAIPWRA